MSDSFVIEIGKAGIAIAGGFAIPPEEERFAISLSALIQKTEKLHAKRDTMPFAEFESATQLLAVEQRMVRNEFLFSMGSHGHVADEVEEAESSDEVQAGRLENRGQAELTAATRLMTLSERHLIATDTGEALKAMRGALAAVQKALSRHRYFLRTMPIRGEIDLSRRLTGDLSTAASARWPANDQTPDARLARVRAILADLASLAGALESASGNHTNAPDSRRARPQRSPAHVARIVRVASVVQSVRVVIPLVERRRGRRARPRARSRVRVAAKRIRRADAGLANAREAQRRRRERRARQPRARAQGRRRGASARAPRRRRGRDQPHSRADRVRTRAARRRRRRAPRTWRPAMIALAYTRRQPKPLSLRETGLFPLADVGESRVGKQARLSRLEAHVDARTRASRGGDRHRDSWARGSGAHVAVARAACCQRGCRRSCRGRDEHAARRARCRRAMRMR